MHLGLDNAAAGYAQLDAYAGDEIALAHASFGKRC
jgi:hypothetical protein